jgi:hypothetical protein
MGSINLALKDIFRQKQRSLLFIAVQSPITASGMIFYGISLSLHAQLGNTEALFNSILLQLFYGHLNFLFFFSIGAGICVASILSSLLTIARMNDLAVIQSLGATFKRSQRLILTQIFLLTLFSGILGWIAGIFGLSVFSFLLGSSSNPFETLNLIFGLLYILGLIFGTYFVAGFIVNVIIRKKSQEIIDGQYEVMQIDSTKLWGFIPIKRNSGLRLAYLFTKRSRILSWVVTFGMFILILVTSFGILGGNIIMTTTNSYIDRGYGENIYVISTPEISSLLQNLYDPTHDLIFDGTYLTEDYAIPSSFLSQLPTSSNYETRLLLLSYVKLVPRVIFDPDQANVSTGWAVKQAYYWGLSTSPLFNYYGLGNFSVPNADFVHIGDGIPQYALYGQKAHAIMPFYGETDEVYRLEIDGVFMDPFARGNCVYMSSREMASLLELSNPSMKNVVFIVNPSAELFNLIEEFSLDFFSLKQNKEQYNALCYSFWFTSTIAFVPVIISASLSLVAYSGLIARVILINDLRTLRELGSNQKLLKRIIIWVNLLILAFAAPLGIFLGYSTAFSLLIEEAIFPTIEAWIILILEFITMAILVYWYLHYLFKEFYKSF